MQKHMLALAIPAVGTDSFNVLSFFQHLTLLTSHDQPLEANVEIILPQSRICVR